MLGGAATAESYTLTLRASLAGMKNIPSLAPLRKGGADEVSRGVDSIRLIYTKTNK